MSGKSLRPRKTIQPTQHLIRNENHQERKKIGGGVKKPAPLGKTANAVSYGGSKSREGKEKEKTPAAKNGKKR